MSSQDPYLEFYDECSEKVGTVDSYVCLVKVYDPKTNHDYKVFHEEGKLFLFYII